METPPAAGWDLKELTAWQVAMDLAVAVCRLTRQFPVEERYELGKQARRSAVSVASNIAEGHGRAGKREFVRFILIARGSLKELETQILIADRLGYVQPPDLQKVLEIILRENQLLAGLRRRFR